MLGADAALAALSLTRPGDTDALRRVAAGGTTRDLDAKLAVEVVNLLPAEAVLGATAGERRSTVTAAAAKRCRRDGVELGDPAAVAEALTTMNAATSTGLLEQLTVGCRTAALTLLASGDPAQGVAAVARHLTRARNIELAHPDSGEGGDPQMRARVVLAAATAGHVAMPGTRSMFSHGCHGATLADVTAAAVLHATLAGEIGAHVDGTVIGGRHLERTVAPDRIRANLAAGIWALGGTAAQMAELHGHNDPRVVPDSVVDDWLSTLEHLEVRPLDELLDAVTGSGSVRRHTSRNPLERIGDQLTVEVAASFTVDDDHHEYSDDFVALIGTRHGGRWDDERIIVAVRANPQLACAVYEHLGGDPNFDAPGELISDAMAANGIAPWLSVSGERSCRALTRLRAAATGAHLDWDGWRTLWQLSAGFRGTPEQLVAVTTEVVPAGSQPVG